MIVADTRSGLQVAAAQGSVEKADWGVGGALGGASAIGILGAYANTAEGKIVAASFFDNWNNVARATKGNSALHRTSLAAQQEPSQQETPQAETSVAAPIAQPEKKPVPAPGFEKGDVLVGKIGGVKIFAEPSDKSRTVRTLARTDTVLFPGREVDGFLNVQGEKGTGWIDKMFLKRE